MKQGASFALFAALLLAVARHPGADSTTPKLSHPAIAGMPRLHATSKPASARYQGCTAFEFNKQPKSALLDPHYGEANKLFHRFLGDNSDDGSPKADSRSAAGLTYVIALMPDPRHTHLALWFDRNIEVIQQAAQDERYTYDSSWLPWPSSGPQPYLLRDQELQEEASEEQRESCPGHLLFRHSVDHGQSENYKNGLAVLLVAEQPTGGINTKQWQNATQWLGSHQDPKTPLRILGPTFSGSVPSLERLLEDHRSPQAIIAGGGLGSANATDWFIQQTHIPLHLFEENDPVQFEYLKTYEVYRNYGSDQQDCNGLAILSEDETAYGSAPIELNSSGAQRKTTLSEDETPYGSAPIDPNSPRALRKTTQTPCLKLFYPRDISALRSAYEEQSILSPSNNSSARAPRVVLHANLKEESVKGGDTVPDFDQQREALSQEAKLYGIVSELNVHHTKLILLRCTNPLDYLFLASFLHYRYPEGRLISSTSDLLFRRALDTSEYRGMLALSNYPLYPEEAHLLGDQKPADDVHRVFASDNQEAAYNAARCVIKGEGCLKGGDGFPVDYHDPLWIKMQSNHAPVWLSVLGRDGYWPVARLPIGPPTALRACGSALTKPAGEPSKSAGELCTSITDIHHADTFPEASPESPLSWKIALFATIVVLGINVWEIQRRNLYDFRMTSDMSTSKWGGHLFFGLAPTVFALLLSSVALTPLVLLFFTHLSFSNRLWFDMVVVASLAILILQTGRGLHQAYGSHGVLACLGSVTAGSILLGLYLWVPERELLIYRSLHLLNGVSPLLPLLFFLFGFYLFARQVLICSSLLAEGKPELPRPKGLPGALCMLSADLAIRIEMAASPSTRRYTVWLAPLGFVGLTIALYRNNAIGSIELRPYDLTINLLVLAAVFCLLHSAGRLFLTWYRLQVLLIGLGRVPVRRTLAALDAVSLDSLWKMSGGAGRVQYTFLLRQLDALRRLKLAQAAVALPVETALKVGNAFVEHNAGRAPVKVDWASALEIQGERHYLRHVLGEAAAVVLSGTLEPYWRNELTFHHIANETTAGRRSTDHAEGSIPAAELQANPTLYAAEEFIAYFYISYVQNILAAMRTMVFSMVSLFVGLSMALAFYPFAPRNAIGVLLLATFLFVASTVGVVYAGMERDEALSLITNTKPQLGWDFVLKFGTFALGPLLGLLTTQFPQFAETVLGWLQPGLQSLK